MRILFATYTLAFQNPGGGEQVLLSTKRSLEELGHSVEFFNSWATTCPSHFDAIHYFSSRDSWFWEYAKRTYPNVPLLVTPTQYGQINFANKLRYLRQRIGTQIENWSMGRSFFSKSIDFVDAWLPATHHEARLVKTIWNIPAEKIHILPNGVGEHFFSGKEGLFSKTFQINTPFVLHVGRFDPVKNHFVLIRAVRKAQVHCVFIGEQNWDYAAYYQECRKTAEELMRSDPSGKTKYTFLPRIDHESELLASAYASAAAFVLPSKFETFALAAFEAGASGCPLILSNQIWSRQFLEPIASFIDPDDEQSLAEKIRFCVEKKPMRQDLTRRKELFNRFQWKTIALDLIGHYQSICPSLRC